MTRVLFCQKHNILILTLFTILLITKFDANAQSGSVRNVNLFIGGKALLEDNLAPEERAEAGIEIDFREESWPISFVTDFLFSINGETEIYELNFGARKIWNSSQKLHPFIGGGVALIRVDPDSVGVYDPDASRVGIDGELIRLGGADAGADEGAGLWIGGGLYWTFNSINIGFRVKTSYAKVYDLNAGGIHFGALIGFH